MDEKLIPYKSLYEKGRECLPEMDFVDLDLGDVTVFIYYFPDEIPRTLFQEAKSRGAVYLGKGYSIRKDKPHGNAGEYHLHFYKKNKEIGALNMKGSTHDSWHGTKLPQKVLDGIAKHFPDFTPPKDGLLEAAFKVKPHLSYYAEDEDKFQAKMRLYS